MKNKIILTVLLLVSDLTFAMACELCKKNQPKVLENITHGAGPTGTLDYIITWTAVVIVTVTLIMSIRLLIKPREVDSDHIKNIVLNHNN
jgi:hypothetical protein